MDTQQLQSIRILHTADLHLDSAFQSAAPAQAEARRQALRQALLDMADYVAAEHIDIVLMAGDLFDEGFVTPETVKALQKTFERMSQAEIFIAPGNHDPYTGGSVYAARLFPPHVHVFSEETLRKYTCPRLPVTVFGWAFTQSSYMNSPLAGYRAEDDGRLQLLCGHGCFDAPLSAKAPLTAGDIQAFGAHYAAIGHIHTDHEVKRIGHSYYGYCGCLMGRSFDETGRMGVHVITARQGGEGWQLSFDRKSFASYHYEKLVLDVTGAPDVKSVAAAITRAIKEEGYDAQTLLRVTLTGELAPDFPTMSLQNCSAACGEGLELLTVEDKTLPIFDTAVLRSDMSIRGEVYRAFLPLLSEGTQQERTQAGLALKAALAALEGRAVAE